MGASLMTSCYGVNEAAHRQATQGGPNTSGMEDQLINRMAVEEFFFLRFFFPSPLYERPTFIYVVVSNM